MIASSCWVILIYCIYSHPRQYDSDNQSSLQQSVRQTTQNDVLIQFSMGFVKERINTSIDVSENKMEYFLKNLNYVVVF